MRFDTRPLWAVILVSSLFLSTFLVAGGTIIEGPQASGPEPVKPLDAGPDPTPLATDYHSLNETEVELQQIATDHPDITKLISVGQSWEGREIWAMKISDNPEIEEDEPEVYFNSNHHAREWLTIEIALYIINYLTDNYGTNATITDIVDNRQIWVLPCCNPDGREYDSPGDEPAINNNWRKNRRDNGDGSWGVDLNRNYGYMWGNSGASADTSEPTYSGPYPFSEPESVVIRDFCRQHEFVFAISYHTYSQLILYPWGYIAEPSDDDLLFSTVANEMADRITNTVGSSQTGYTPMQSSDLYTTAGTDDDWLYGELGIYAFCVEAYPAPGDGLPDPFHPPASSVVPVCNDNLPAALYLCQIADNPFQVMDHVTIEPQEDQLRIVGGGSNNTVINVTDDGQRDDVFDLTHSTIPGWIISIIPDTQNLLRNQTNQSTLSITVPGGETPGTYTIWVNATSQTNLSCTDSCTVTIEVPHPNDVSPIEIMPFEDFQTYPMGYYVFNGTVKNVGDTTVPVFNTDGSIYRFGGSTPTTLFSDDMESGSGNWQVIDHDGGSSPSLWHLVTDRSNSPTNSWWCGPSGGGNYNDDTVQELLMLPTVDLRGVSGANMTYWTYYNIENAWDFLCVDGSGDGGQTWDYITRYTGIDTSWTQRTLDLSDFLGSTDFKIRFRFSSDAAVNSIGFWLDDVEIVADIPGETLVYGPTPVFTGGPLDPEEEMLCVWDYTFVQEGTYRVAVDSALGTDGNPTNNHLDVIIDIYMPPNPPPIVTVTYPSAADIIESGSFNITWDATDVGTADEDLVIDIYYSDDGGSSWTLIDSGLFNTVAGSGTYSWATVSDGVNYRIRVIATDDGVPAMTGLDYSDNPFSIDNVADDRWHFQASAPVELSMYPVELTPNTLSTPIDSAGYKSIGAWSSQVFAGGTGITGQWDFSAWGYSTIAGSEGYLCARIYSSSDYPGLGWQWETSNCPTDVGTVFTWTDFTWSDAGVTGNIIAGDSIIVELLVEAVSGAAASYTYDVANGESGTAPSSGDFTDTWTSNNVNEEITETPGGAGIIWADGFESGDFSAWNLVDPDWEVNEIGTDSIGGYLISYVPEGSWIATGSDSNNADDYFGMDGLDLSNYASRQVTYSFFEGDMEAGEFGLVDLWYDGAWHNIAQYQTDLGDRYSSDASDWDGSAPDGGRIVVDLEAQGIVDWTDVGIRFGTNAACEATDPLHIDWVVFDGTVPSWLEHTWTVPVTGGIDVEVGVEAYHTANGEGDDFDFYYSTTGAGTIDTWTPMFTVSKTADDDVAQTYSDAILDVFSGTLYIGVLDADRTPGNGVADTLFVDYLYVQSETAGPNFVFGYDYGATQSYVEVIPIPPNPNDIDLTGVLPGEWVFISFPTDATGTVDVVFDDANWGSDAPGDEITWDYIQWYDNLNKEWRSYSIYKPAPINDVDIIDNTLGFWIHITANPLAGDEQLTVGSGVMPAGPVFIDLYTGWNLVGYPSATPRAGDVTLPAEADLVSVYDLAEPYRIRDELKSAVTFTEGNAYWVRVTGNCVWQVDP